MRSWQKHVLIVMCGWIAGQFAWAQTPLTSYRETRRWILMPEVGVLIPRFDVDSRLGLLGGIGIGYQLTPNWQAQFMGRYMETAHSADRWGREYQGQYALLQLRVQYTLNQLLGPEAPSRFRPFLTLALTGVQNNISNTLYTGVPDEAIDYKGFDFGYSAGLGVAFHLSNRIDLRLGAEYHYTGSDRLDGHAWFGPSNQSTDQFVTASVGVNIKLGSTNKRSLAWSHLPAEGEVLPKPVIPTTPRPVQVLDRDQDGVADSLDLDNNTPPGVRVTSRGVPMDTDYDGIADYLDPCPTQAGTNGKGCPEPVAPADTVPAQPAKSWFIIAGSLLKRENAVRLLEQLQAKGYSEGRIIVHQSFQPGTQPVTYYRVAVKGYLTKAEALGELPELKAKLRKSDLWILEEKP